MKSSMKGFVLRAFAWTMLLLVAWFWLSAWIAPAVSVSAGYLMHLLFPTWVNGAAWNGSILLLITDLPLSVTGTVSAQRFEGKANLSMLAMGWPLYIALLLASRAQHFWRKLLLGTLILLPFVLWSIGFVWFSQVLTDRGAYTVEEFGLSPWQLSLIALASQLGKLVFPLTIPVLIWLWLENESIRRLFLQESNKT